MLKETLAALDLRVELNGQMYRPKLKPGDMVRFEQHFGRSLMDGAEVAPDGTTTGFKFGMSELFFLAFAALKRQGDFDGDFDDFCDQVEDVDLAQGKADASAGTPSPT
jgi:hypothetical protein